MNIFSINVLLLFFYFRTCNGLYEDQIGKFEWRQQYVGKLKFAHFDVVSPIKKILVATEKNVLAALSLKTGDIIWRQILESDENGTIRYLSVDKEIITITGTNLPLVRAWDLEKGFLMWEWGIAPLNEFTTWISFKEKLLQVDFESGFHIILNSFHSSTGKKIKSQIIPALWLIPEKCVIQSNVIACISKDKFLYSIKIVEENDDIKITIHHRSLLDLFQQEVSKNLKTTSGKLPIVTLNIGGVNKAIILQPEIQVLNISHNEFSIFSSIWVHENTIVTSIALVNKVLEVTTTTVDGNLVPHLSSKLNFDEEHGNPEFAHLFCQPRKDKSTACRLLISTSHNVILLIQHPGKILWAREESLSSILSVEMVGLPVSDIDSLIEKKHDEKNSGFIWMFFRRVTRQAFQLYNTILMLLGILKGALKVRDSETMIQDGFGLHKLIIAATEVGKIYGIDNLSGKKVWQIKIDDIEPFTSGGTEKAVMPLYLLRSARHHPLIPECVLLARQKLTGNTVLVTFNPIDGSFTGKQPVLHLGFKIKQSLQIHKMDDNFYKGVLLLDEKNKIHVFPEACKSVVVSDPSSIFIFTADATSGILEGFTLSSDDQGALFASKTWQIRLGAQILTVVGKKFEEKVHSQGRVLGDRSVLYKYVNPNLIVVITRAFHPNYKTIINLYLIDIVSGIVIYSSNHRRAKEPVHVVHSENWVVYTYTNEKYRRTELAALEMYEGKTQSNATAFSSVDSATLLPIVEKQAYILPANVLGLKETITEKGITSKHILIALSTGGILELPWAYADPRRPMTVTSDMQEEGVIPYMPELPAPLEAIINHNQTVNNIKGIYTSSSGLESTCLVFVYGLDIFYTRVAPSKTFDLLKDDFDYYLITLVLIGLTMISYLTKRLASRKALKQAWK